MKLAKLKSGNYIDLSYAQKVIKQNCKTEKDFKGKDKTVLFEGLTTSKLRNLLDYLNHIYTKVYNETDTNLSEDVCDELDYLKVKFAYEAARDKSVALFIQKTHVSQIVDVVIKNKTKKKFLDYCKYFEALVAYAKFYNKED